MHKLLDKIKNCVFLGGFLLTETRSNVQTELMIYLGMKRNVINQEMENLFYFQNYFFVVSSFEFLKTMGKTFSKENCL